MKISDEILFAFRRPDHPLLKDVLTLWNYRGDGTQSGDDRALAALGAEAYAHYHWDTVVSNGSVTLVIPRHKHPAGRECPGGLSIPAEVWWCVAQITKREDVEPAPPALVRRVAPDIHESLKIVPDVEWMRVQRVNYFSYGRGRPKRKSQPPPKDLAFFRFAGGVGIASVTA